MAYFVRANTHLLKNEIALALADFAETIRLNPAYFPAHQMRGLMYLEAGAYAEALEEFNSVVRIDPRNAPGLYTRGVIFHRMGNAAAGKADIDAAEALAPGITASLSMGGLRP
jgi:lipoprotein NlpI